MNAISRDIKDYDREREKVSTEISFFYRVFLTKLFYKGNHNLKIFYKNFLDDN
jgi:hypothetical protein